MRAGQFDAASCPGSSATPYRTLRVIRQNIAFALGVKLLVQALAGAGLASLWMAIAADMGASPLVIANALRLLRTGWSHGMLGPPRQSRTEPDGASELWSRSSPYCWTDDRREQ